MPSVTELMLAELLYLQYDDPKKPIYMYINSAGVTVSLCSSNSARAFAQLLAGHSGRIATKDAPWLMHCCCPVALFWLPN